MKHTNTFYLKIKLWIILIGIGFGNYSSFAQGYDNDNFGLIMSRISDKFESSFQTTNALTNVPSYLSLYDAATGAFTDIDYTSTQRTNWPPFVHLERIRDLVFLYTMPGNAYSGNADVFAMIQGGLQYWQDKGPECTNWWYNQIAAPQTLGVILIQMKKGGLQVPAPLETAILQRMASKGGNPASQTGANRTDVALHWLYRACLTKNAAIMNTTMGYAYSSVKYGTSDEIQHDWTFFSHGKQFYNFGYGDEFIKGVTQFALYTQGTEYAISDEKLKFLDEYVRNGYFNLIVGSYIPFNSLGRGMSRPNKIKRQGAIAFAKDMQNLYPAQQQEYEKYIKRISEIEPASYEVNPVNQTFFIGDYIHHQRATYAVNVRTVSTRTLRNEFGNGENLKTYFVSDGSTNIMTKGNEYFNIFPVWDWARIPGTTAPYLTTIPKAPNNWETPGTSTFCGGVSDNIYGASSYVYFDSYSGINTGANKSWFFFDDEVVCLGANIKSSATATINTTVNQARLSNDVQVYDGQNTSILETNTDKLYSGTLKWVLHDNIGYYFPNGGNIHVSNKAQSGSWYNINNNYSKDVLTENVFSLWFDHGSKPDEGSYAYMIVPNKKTPAEMSAYNANNIEILSNTDSVQVVRHKGLNIWEMIFTKAATFRYDDLCIEVSAGCALILKNVGTSEISMHIADPAQNLGTIRVNVLAPAVSAHKKMIVCDFSAAGAKFAGQTKVYKINADSPDYEPPMTPPSDTPKQILSSVPLADTYVYDGSKNSNYGNDNSFVVKKDNAGYQRSGYLKFSLADMEKGATLDSVRRVCLHVYPTQVNSGYANVNWALYAVADTTWSETGLTWNNAASAGTTPIATQKGTFYDNGDYLESNVLQFDITEYAWSEYTKGNKIISVCMSATEREPNGKGDARFATKEHLDARIRPSLSFYIYDNVPHLTYEKEQLVLEDAYVDTGGKDTNYGGAYRMIVKNTNDGSLDRKGYLKFNISNLVNGEKEFADKVYVRLYAFTGNIDSDKPDWIIKAVPLQNWSETSITYNNRPESAALIASLPGFIPTEDQGGAPIETNYVYFDVSDYVREQIALGHKSVSFMLYQSSNGNKYDMQYFSKELKEGDYIINKYNEGEYAAAKRPYLTTKVIIHSHKVYLPDDVAGAELSETGTVRVAKGENFTFTVKPLQPNVTVTVKANGMKIDENAVIGNTYTYYLPHLSADQKISVELSSGSKIDQEHTAGDECISVYPTTLPKRGVVTIRNHTGTSQTNVILYDLAGQVIRTASFVNPVGTMRMPESPGVYILHVKCGLKTQKTIKIIIE
ncbi:MAG: polysaccharide lyase family 8 super-sandwich domain-containing protein [Dysgonamonadaceae bacterium]